LLHEGWQVIGVSRSESPIVHQSYTHFRYEVTTLEYRELLSGWSQQGFDGVIYCVGVGERLAQRDLGREARVFEVNLLAAVATAAIVLPPMLTRGGGHWIVLSSLADALVSDEFPSYNASKAGLSAYFEGLGAALRTGGVVVSHIRFGFVDTKWRKLVSGHSCSRAKPQPTSSSARFEAANGA
jgi:short-subunit dehydrogenase